MSTRCLRTILLLLTLASFAPAQTVVNGDFEDVNISPDFFTFDASTYVPGLRRVVTNDTSYTGTPNG